MKNLKSIMNFHRKQMNWIMQVITGEWKESKAPQFNPEAEMIENDINEMRFEEVDGENIRFHNSEDEIRYTSKHS